MEMGKKVYIHEANCATTSNIIYNGIVESSNTSTTTKNCSDVQTGQSWQGSSAIKIFSALGRGYIHEQNCWTSANMVYSGIHTIDNTLTTSATCTTAAGLATYQGFSSIRTFPLLGSRYIQEGNCWAATGILYSGIKEANNFATTTFTCNDIQS